MTLQDMEVGCTYTIGDSYGYDRVLVIKKAEKEDYKKYIGSFPENAIGVVVQFINEENRVDLVFETPECSSVGVYP